ncbi:hypothetical protein CV102_14510 [Natronococcus pandeyae]|uniref:DUF302 domain-containing protein n=1 Tax=Natronococcus pandeyae TaxID=2055836 RepID=A0A8J8TRF7_9EURY|nr:DUF302 domain-containing protein [Natronococcus pandeyae]TYL37930.1 hypothetical protein CV102_14510 [Natronococcus pandeyae]
MSYTLNKRVDGEFDDVVERTISELEDAGFGVLCDIDVQATLEKKLGESFRQYRILGACNPELAHQGLEAELELGALLPCNVIVYEADDGDVVVSPVAPEELLAVTGNSELDSIGEEVRGQFEQVLENL